MPLDASTALDLYSNDLRSLVLELAATLDRLERAPGAEKIKDDPRLARIRKSLAILNSLDSDRATQIQIALSDPSD